jgi:WD40 repeat protein
MAGRRRPAGLVTVTAFRSDSRRLATTGANGDLKLWDTTDPRQPALLMRLTDRHRITAAAWNPAATDLLATLSTDGRISVWRMVDEEEPHEVRSLRLPYGRSGLLAWLPAGRHLACATEDGAVSIWDIGSGARHTEPLGDEVACLSLTAGADDVLRAVYQDGSVRRMVAGQAGPLRARRITPVTAAAWSATGHRLVAALDGGVLEVRDDALDLQWGRETPGDTLIFAWHGDTEIVLADRTARQLTALDAHGRPLWEINLSTPPTSVAAADGVVAVGGCNFRPQLVDLRTGAPLTAA